MESIDRFVRLFARINSIIQHYKPAAEQNTADNVGQPMDTGKQSANDHKHNKYGDQKADTAPQTGMPDAGV